MTKSCECRGEGREEAGNIGCMDSVMQRSLGFISGAQIVWTALLRTGLSHSLVGILGAPSWMSHPYHRQVGQGPLQQF